MVSDELPRILRWGYTPPRQAGRLTGKKPAGAWQVLLGFATTCISDTTDREMKVSAHLFLSPPKDFSQEHLTSLDFGKLMK
jgi:hypothetical protein